MRPTKSIKCPHCGNTSPATIKKVATIAPCRACEGDGIIAADADTPPHERVTRSSRRCPYCNGKGTATKKLELEPTITKPAPSAGKCQPLGDPAASCTGTYPDVDGTYADCGDYDCPRHVPTASSAKPKGAS
jgi:hypothetical protein